MSHPSEILRGASPEVLVDTRMAMITEHKQIEAACGGKIYDCLYFMARNNGGLKRDVMQRCTALRLASWPK
jgi:hypothetical protein